MGLGAQERRCRAETDGGGGRELEEPPTAVSTLTEDAHYVSALSGFFFSMWEYESRSNAWLALSLSELKRITVILTLSLSSHPSLCCHHYICLRGDSRGLLHNIFPFS